MTASADGDDTGASSRRPQVVVYTRKRCGLCRAAEEVVAEITSGRADVRMVDVDEDPELAARYTVRVPVVAVDGVEVAESVVDRADLESALALTRP